MFGSRCHQGGRGAGQVLIGLPDLSHIPVPAPAALLKVQEHPQKSLQAPEIRKLRHELEE